MSNQEDQPTTVVPIGTDSAKFITDLVNSAIVRTAATTIDTASVLEGCTHQEFQAFNAGFNCALLQIARVVASMSEAHAELMKQEAKPVPSPDAHPTEKDIDNFRNYTLAHPPSGSKQVEEAPVGEARQWNVK
jgi:hypothetical protein